MANVILNMDARDQALAKALDRMTKKADTLQARLEQGGRKGAGSFDKAGESIRNVAMGMIGANGITGAVQSLISTVKAAYQEMLNEHRTFLQNIQTESEAKASFFWNMPQIDKDEAEKMAGRVATEGGVDRASAWRILSSGVSAGGEGERLMESAILAAQAKRRGQVEGPELMGGLLDLTKFEGMGSAREALAFVQQIAGASRGVTLKEQLQVVKSLVAGELSGDRVEESGAILAAMTQVISDAEESMSATGAANFIGRMRSEKMVPFMGMNEKTGMKEMQFRRARGESTLERLEDLRGALAPMVGEQREDAMEQIREKAGGRAVLKAVVEAIVTDSSIWREQFATARRKIKAPGSEESMANLANMEKALSTGMDAVANTAKEAQAQLTTAGTIGQDRENAAAAVAARDMALGGLRQQGMSGIIDSYAIRAIDGITGVMKGLADGGYAPPVDHFRTIIQAGAIAHEVTGGAGRMARDMLELRGGDNPEVRALLTRIDNLTALSENVLTSQADATSAIKGAAEEMRARRETPPPDQDGG